MTDVRVSPDGARYLAMAGGQRVPQPFNDRWLLPFFAGPEPRRWVSWQRSAMATCCFLAVSYCHTWWAFPIPLALSGLTINLKLPVLVDLPAMECALGAAVALQRGWWPLALVLVLIAGATKETAPVFAALWAWNPLLLVGMLAPAIRHLFWKPGPDVLDGPAAEALTHPWRASLEAHRGQWLAPAVWLAPWGPLLIGFGRPSWQVGGTLIVAYAQCLIATDSTRLFVWAWPVLAAQTFAVVDARWWPLIAVLAFANPAPGTGV